MQKEKKVEKVLPNFLIVGAAKSGTTSLYRYLNQHPDVYIHPKKEGKFFSQMRGNFNGPRDYLVERSVTKTLEDYMGLFSSVSTEKAIGDVSPDYLYYYQNSINKIREVLGKDIKIIIILRNTIERAFSQYNHLCRNGRETLSFEDALESEEERRRLGWEWTWYYRDVGYYSSQVRGYLEAFGKDRVKIYLHDDFSRNSVEVVKDAFRFLDVDDSFKPDVSNIYNSTLVPKYKALDRFLSNYDHPVKKLTRGIVLSMLGLSKTEGLVNYFKRKNLTKKKLSEKTKNYLIEVYREDILKLEDLINRDLSAWLK